MTKADLLKYIDSMLTQRSDGNIGLLMVRQYVEDNMEDHHTQNLKAYAHDFGCTIEEAEKTLMVDRVNVIRCKECAIRYDACPMVVRAGITVAFFSDDNDFCSRGRRKE